MYAGSCAQPPPLLVLLLVLVTPARACFNKSICSGDTPRLDPENYFCMIRGNMRKKINNPLFVKFVDKLLYKEFCKKHNLKTAEVYSVFDQSEYYKVDVYKHSSYVLKSNKASGRLYVVKNGTVMGNKVLGHQKGVLDEAYRARIMADMQLWGRPHNGAERFYDHIKPKVFTEEFLEPFPDDIKIYMLNGLVDLIQICKHGYYNFYDAEMNMLPYVRYYTPNFNPPSVADVLQQNATKLKQLTAIAEKLAADVPLNLVRIDLFLLGDEFYGGEITLSPSAGNDFIQHKDNPRHPTKGDRNKHFCNDPSMKNFLFMGE